MTLSYKGHERKAHFTGREKAAGFNLEENFIFQKRREGRQAGGSGWLVFLWVVGGN